MKVSTINDRQMAVSWENSLPIDPILPELARTVALSPNTVLRAPPGAGKTTRVPLALLDLPALHGGRIVMLEPRRLAAVHAASRMAAFLGERAGETVGYAMRFERRVSARTRIEVVTEGILTRRLQRDPCLEGISLVIFDEFHERSIHADLALALCLEVQREIRPDLRILVMSATLDCGPVAALLGNAPIVASEGRAFPVEVRYLEDRGHGRFAEKMARAVRRALAETEGDILAFLPGSGEIRECQELLRESCAGTSLSIRPLYGDLPLAEQERAILPGPERRVVLATSIAETSLTIEGVRVVVDGGLSRMLRHDPSTGLNRLTTVRESRASAEQRTGRAGRLGPGVCYRLFGSHTFSAMTPFSPPEMMVTDLSSLVLELAVWGVREPSLSWLDPPPEAAVAAARKLLCLLGALDGEGRPTATGRRMAELPVHPRLARMLLRGEELGMREAAACFAALLTERDIFRREPGGMAQICASDPLERYEALRGGTSRRNERLVDGAVSAVKRTAFHLARLMAGEGRKPLSSNFAELGAEDAARLLLAACPDRVAARREEGGDRYLLANGRGARLSPASGLRGRAFILAAHVDAREGAEGVIHQASALTPELLRTECRTLITTGKKVVWEPGQERVVAWEEERLGALILSRRPTAPTEEEAAPLLLSAVRESAMQLLSWERPVLQFQGRSRLVRGVYPEEEWPDLSVEALTAKLEDWLAPFLAGARSRSDLAGLDLLNALKSLFSPRMLRLLEVRAPTHVTVPSGRRVEIDYVSREEPVLAVKLQELFGLADTPTIAEGRVKLLLHLLSPAGRPVQVTRDLRNFWERGYPEVRRELRGRYPRHPWPDDPWSAVPTRKTTRMLKGEC